MRKNISKAIWDRVRRRSKFLKNRSPENRFAYNQARNFCVSLIRKTIQQYCNNLHQKNFTGSKLFWNTRKLFVSDKGATKIKFTLIEDDQIIDDDCNISSQDVSKFTYLTLGKYISDEKCIKATYYIVSINSLA